ncbi:Aldo/keto reductase family-domain-containing protein [Talaromyces proteolyticus]|uniref:Aldo/keto reductase family-domain-containing protein n=1 Tax=Talaromyces proteolyticus TaxID=1131652 RepID=A0AAD4KLJ8_9EURO|nr:Aldo/keto reductase family-domain-containing protein [Talaromyces proteolyticus]KAH8690871.1 Aldo/keto reductase family-domain-containing protein [Talaromyces proteolyticus]
MMKVLDKPASLANILPPVILGGAGFSYQVYPDPNISQVRQVLQHAFDLGMRAIDTSSYYEPSEQLLGQALSESVFSKRYPRDKYILMTKVGRIAPDRFDYSPSWVQFSVNRSLERLHTSYLDVVFCHDIEYVTEEAALEAIGALLEMVREGKVRYIGASSYRIDLLLRLARSVLERYDRPLDVVQNWAQMTLQNNRLETDGLAGFRDLGVSCVCNASPLTLGLLRSGGVPVGSLGDFHPAPAGLRAAAHRAAEYVTIQGKSLAALALRYAIWRAHVASSTSDFQVSTITGISSINELVENMSAVNQILQSPLRCYDGSPINLDQVERDIPLWNKIQDILGTWLNFSFTSPEENWDVEQQRMIKPKL